jgi:hypothetical protein
VTVTSTAAIRQRELHQFTIGNLGALGANREAERKIVGNLGAPVEN